MKEKISQLVDQELDIQQQSNVFDELKSDVTVMNIWQRYHLIGNIMRGEVDRTGADMSDRIRRTLDKEPTVLAPGKLTPDNAGLPRNGILKPISLLAAAASLAVAAVIVLNPLENNGNINSVADTDSASRQYLMLTREFNEMLVEHGEFTSSSGLNGLLAYAKLVSRQQLDK